jgi:small subunit ribosomal protein S7
MALKKRTASEETLKPDAVYDSRLASKFINCLMWGGKKATAMRIFYHAMGQIKKRLGENTSEIEVFEQAVENVKPSVEVRSKRVGGATYQVPVPVNKDRQRSLAIRWIIQATRAKKGKPMHLRLAEELLAAYRREGDAMTKRENTIKMAESNKAFAHFAW